MDNTEVEEKVPCYECEKPIQKDEAQAYKDTLYCVECYDELFASCNSCNDVGVRDDMRIADSNNRIYCEDCYCDIFAHCENCGDEYRYRDEGGNDLCNICYDSDNGGFEERQYSKADLPQFQSDKKGRIIKSSRMFSAEIECYYPGNTELHRAIDALPVAVGMTEDGSLNENGIEFQTPKLKGAKGEQALKHICKALNDNNFSVDNSAGLHIHLDGKGLERTTRDKEPIALKQLFAFYVAFDDVIRSFLPVSRRESDTYCRSMSAWDVEEILTCDSKRGVEVQWYEESSYQDIDYRKRDHKDGSRYRGINMHALIAMGHLEIRYHSGTTNSRKMLEWIHLHQTIMDKAAARKLSYEDIRLGVTLKDDAKLALFYKMLGLCERSRNYLNSRREAFAGCDSEESMKAQNLSAQVAPVCAV